MKKTLLLLTTVSFIAFYACQSTKTEETAITDSTVVETSAPAEVTMPVDSVVTSDSTAVVVQSDSIK